MRTTARHVHSAMPLFLGAMLTSLSLDARSWPEGVPLGTAAAAIVAFFVAAEATPVHGSACFALSFGTLSWLVPHVAIAVHLMGSDGEELSRRLRWVSPTVSFRGYDLGHF